MSRTARRRQAARRLPSFWFAWGCSADRGCGAWKVRRRPIVGATRVTTMGENREGRDTRGLRAASSAPVDARLHYRDSADPGLPEAHGLYDPSLAKDSCGVGFIADIKGRKSH